MVARWVPVGPHGADFLCWDAKLIVELDGASHDGPERRAHDGRRDAWLEAQGFRVFRFPDDLAIGGTGILVRQIEAVLEAMKQES